MKRNLLAIFKYIVTLSLAFGLLWYAFRDISIKNMLNQLGTVKFGWIYLSVFLSIISHLLRAFRWQMLVRPLNYSVPLNTFFWAVMIGYLANLAFPRMGEITRCGVIKKTNEVKMSASMGTVVTERIFDVIVLFLILIVTFLVEFDRLNQFFIDLMQDKMPELNLTLILQVASVAVIALGLAALIAFRYKALIIKTLVFQKLKSSIIHFKEGLLSIRKIDNIPVFLMSTAGIWLMYYLMSYVIVFSIPQTSQLDWVAGLAILVVGGIAMSAPVQGGIGTYHFLIGALLVLYSIEWETGVFFATLLHTSQTLSVMTLGSLGLMVVFLQRRNIKLFHSDGS